MNIKKTLYALGIASLTSSAFAVGDGFYMGAEAGSTNAKSNPHVVYFSTVPNSPIFPSSITIKPKTTTGTGERLLMGFKFNPYGAFEMGYTHYAAVSYPLPFAVAWPAKNPSIRLSAIDFDGVISYPISRVNIFAKLGIAYLRESLSGSMLSQTLETDTPVSLGPGETVEWKGKSGTTNTVKPLIGFGVSVDITQRWVADITYTQLMGGNTITFTGIGITYHFASEMCGQFLC